ncbi:MAG: hypothetical protein WBE38_04520, partial [Terracidiphilus sp.]
MARQEKQVLNRASQFKVRYSSGAFSVQPDYATQAWRVSGSFQIRSKKRRYNLTQDSTYNQKTNVARRRNKQLPSYRQPSPPGGQTICVRSGFPIGLGW